MDKSKIALPRWLPWATTACLAIFVACLGEIVVIEKARTQLVRDDILLVQAQLKASQNQLEAERIVNRRELEELRPEGGAPRLFLTPPGSDPSDASNRGAPIGVVTWDSTARHALLRFSGLPPLAAGRDYQVWIEGPAPRQPVACGLFHEAVAGGIPVDLQAPWAPECRFLLIDTAKGGAPTLAEAQANGSIVLASLPPAGKISN